MRKGIYILVYLWIGSFQLLYAQVPVLKDKAKAVAGVDISSIVEDMTLRMSFGYGFYENWSADIHLALNLHFLKRDIGKEEQTHDDMFSEMFQDAQDNETNIFHEAGLNFRYWINKLWKGPFLSIGGVISEGYSPDCIAGVGYMIQLWKGLSAELILERRIIEKEDNIRIGICYVF